MTRIHYRIGQIVPSSNTTMETEIPAMLRAREGVLPERFTFHSSRMRMKQVTKDELARMDADSGRCALELSDARVDVLGYACLVAIMSMGRGYHRESEQRLRALTLENEAPAPVVTSAGALVQGLQALGAKKIAVLAPYMKPLTALVVDYLEHAPGGAHRGRQHRNPQAVLHRLHRGQRGHLHAGRDDHRVAVGGVQAPADLDGRARVAGTNLEVVAYFE